ncbi:uncharacterized protein FRV6_15417 [Fusarium oxysporum]|uniref:Uncharacterized protein n=1 Tax=Fusarium oxysporum TaxID=5507 RepID=A0A2H3UBJ9_FUSOX|nr:uncharacterized protein FRV6_15417 [Fusarium oxysporum]
MPTSSSNVSIVPNQGSSSSVTSNNTTKASPSNAGLSPTMSRFLGEPVSVNTYIACGGSG